MAGLRTIFSQLPLATAWRERLRQGYTFAHLGVDLLAGLTVSMLAIPMTMAVAIACGVAPEHGLYGAIIAGPLIALLGGSHLSVTGPVAELSVLIYPVVYQYGLEGLLIASWMAGLMLLIMGLARLGRVIEFIPYPVTTGFIAGTGVVICVLQIKDFFGLDCVVQPKYFLDRVFGLYDAFPSWQPGDTLVGLATLGLMLLWPRLKLRFSGHLVAMIVGSLLGVFLPKLLPGLGLETIGSRYGGIPQTLPAIVSIDRLFDLEHIRALFGSAFAIAMLCAIKALMCAVVLDGMRGTKHDPNAELIAHGIGNLILPWFGALTSTSALSRSVANVRVGATSPLSAMVHGLCILLVVLVLAPFFSYLPMASLSALLLMAAWNIFDYRHCLHIIRVGTRSDVVVLLICFGLTVLLDMSLAVGTGMVLAALLFMKRMATITGGRWLLEAAKGSKHERPPRHVMIYSISGPLFFGAAEKAMSTLREHSADLKAVILDMRDVPTIDISGLVAFESCLASLFQKRIFIVLSEVKAQPLETFQRAGIQEKKGQLAICDNIKESIKFLKKSIPGL